MTSKTLTTHDNSSSSDLKASLSGSRGTPWPLLVAIAFALCYAWLGYVRYAPPPVNNVEAIEGEFSHSNAFQFLDSLVGDGIPHPSDSEQNAVVRQRIIDFFARMGISVEPHETSNVFRRTGEKVPLVNLIARISGTDSTGTIALASHYDTKFSTPGASDNGIGVAVSLEIANYFTKHPPKNDLVFLVTDGEELGLLGAEKFMQEHPLAKQLDVVINLEARGTAGPSLMFETGKASQWSIQKFAATSPKPLTSSLFFEIYKLLPNDTDFSRYREGNLQGFNFAFIGDVKNYHTESDNIENVDRDSLKHQGDNAFELIKVLANEELNIVPGRAVYFDWLGFRVFWWPESWAIPFAVIPLLLFSLTIVASVRKSKFSVRDLLISCFACLLFLLTATAVGVFVNFGMGLDGQFDNPWPYNPLPRELTFWFVGLSLAGCFGRFVCHDPARTFCVIWIGWSVLLLAVSIFAAGASYLFLIPCLAASAGLVIVKYSATVGALLGWFAVCLLWLPVEPLFYDALGFRLNLFLVVRVALVTTALLPVIAVTGQKWSMMIAAISGALAVVCLLIVKFAA